MRLHEETWLAALWLVPALLGLLLWAHRRRASLLRVFLSDETLGRLAPTRPAGLTVARALLLAAGVALIVIALARPQWNARPVEARRLGRDVVFAIDVSRSMLAEDLPPSRLERARIGVKDALRVIEGDRVGLIAFAGTPVVKAPLTLDHAFVRMALEDLSPQSVSRGGSLIGDAIRRALSDVFDEQSEGYRDLILITDGGDQESFPVEAAREAAEAGVRIITLGLGGAGEGAPIPLNEGERGRYVTQEGRIVRTSLDAEVLRQIALATEGGVFFNVGTGSIDLEEIYADLIETSERRELEARAAMRYEEHFQIFLLGGLILLTIEGAMRATTRGVRTI